MRGCSTDRRPLPMPGPTACSNADSPASTRRSRSSLRALVRRPPVVCGERSTVREALAVMHAEGIGCIVVVDARARPVGIFTERDLIGVVLDAGLEHPIADVMTRDPLRAAGPHARLRGGPRDDRPPHPPRARHRRPTRSSASSRSAICSRCSGWARRAHDGDPAGAGPWMRSAARRARVGG